MGNGSTTTEPASGRSGSVQHWFFTVHALQRMNEMAVPRREVLTTLNEPEFEYPARGDRRMTQRGRLAVVKADDVVVTVLWRTTEIYHRADSTAQPSFFASRSGGRSWPIPDPAPGRRCDEHAA